MPNLNLEFDNAFALRFDRPLTPDEILYFQQVTGYAAKSKLMMAEGPSFEWGSQYDSVVTYIDTTKTYSDDASFRFPEFWETLEDMLENGSKPYKRAYRGKPAGFQLIPSIGFSAKIKDSFSDIAYKDNETLFYTTREVESWAFETADTADMVTQENSEQPIVIQEGNILEFKVPDGVKKVTISFEF
jgi:hypothetical protein